MMTEKEQVSVRKMAVFERNMQDATPQPETPEMMQIRQAQAAADQESTERQRRMGLMLPETLLDQQEDSNQ